MNSQILINQLQPDQVSEIVNTKTSGATPLLMACRNGYLEITKFLVLSCQADIELSGSGKRNKRRSFDIAIG